MATTDITKETKLVTSENLSKAVEKIKGKVNAQTTTISNLKVEDLKGSEVTTEELNCLQGVESDIQTQLSDKAPLDSPTFTGTPTAPTPQTGDNSTNIATTAFVDAAIKAIPGTDLTGYVKTSEMEAAIEASEKKIFGDGELAEAFDTIQEIGAYLKDHDDVTKAINDAIAKKADKTDLDEYVKSETLTETLQGYLKSGDLQAMSDEEVDALFSGW